jgi:hypothetical protein
MSQLAGFQAANPDRARITACRHAIEGLRLVGSLMILREMALQ